jgi:sugar/nucleoside kinase (ribokinase family)
VRTTPARRLVALGDLTLDIVVRPSAPIAAGSDVGGEIGFRAGGSAANTARAFAALGGQASFIGAVGRDGLGRRLVAALRAAGVRVHAPLVAAPTARLVVMLDDGGQRSFVTSRGAADQLRAADLRPAWLRGAGVLHVPAYSLLTQPLGSAAVTAAGWAHAGGAMVTVDLASTQPLIDFGAAAVRELLGRVAPDVLFANSDEAAVVAATAEALLQLAPIAVIKDGSAGARVLWRDNGQVVQIDVATRPIKATDTTGAGDAFDAGFLHVLLSSATPFAPPTLRRAAVAGHRAAARLMGRPLPELEL